MINALLIGLLFVNKQTGSKQWPLLLGKWSAANSKGLQSFWEVLTREIRSIHLWIEVFGVEEFLDLARLYLLFGQISLI